MIGYPFFYGRVEMLNGSYMIEALRHNYMPGLLPGGTRNDIEQMAIFLSASSRNTKRVIYPRSNQHNNIMPGLLPGWTRKDIKQLPNFVLRVGMLNVLYIQEAPRHNNIMPGLLPGWTRKNIEQLPNIFRQRVKILNVLYMLEALRHNNIMPGLLPGWTRKDIEQLPNLFSATARNTKRVIYPRSAQA